MAHDLWDDEDFKGLVIEEPSVWGVQDLGLDGVVVRVALKTAPLEQWARGARDARSGSRPASTSRGSRSPFAQRVVWHALGRQRAAQPEVDSDSAPPAQGPAQAEGPA